MDGIAVSAAKTRRARNVFNILGIILFILGVSSIFLYPENSHRTYMSENALMPGSAANSFSQKKAREAEMLSQEVSKILLLNDSYADNLVHLLRSKGLEAYVQEYERSNGEIGQNVYSIVRAVKSSGTESIAFETRYHPGEKVPTGFTSSLGMSISLLLHLKAQRWGAKDILFIVADGRDPHSHSEWLAAYHSGIAGFPRGGIIEGAICLNFQPMNRFGRLAILAEGANGRLPNLDLINTIFRVARRESVGDSQIILSSPSTSLTFPPFPDYPDPYYRRFVTPYLHTLLTFMANQALGIPTGDHGAFHQYHIDAVTLTPMSSETDNLSPYQLARLLEGTTRSLNNLLEQLHQSFYYYLLPAPFLYVSIGEYMISLGLVLGGFVLKALLSVISLPYERHVIHSLLSVAAIQLTGLGVFVLPFVLQRLAPVLNLNLSMNEVMAVWLGLAAILVTILFFPVLWWIDRRFQHKRAERDSVALKKAECFKTLASIPLMLFVSTGSLLNFSFSFFAAVVTVPLYAVIFPSRNALWHWFQALMLIVSSPPVVLALISFYINVDLLWLCAHLVEQFQLYGTFFFPFLCLVYLPTHCSYFRLISY